jgi:hypothetical protein
MAHELQAIGHYPRIFKEWGISVMLIKAEDNGIYVPVRQICTELGINVDNQKNKLNGNPDYAEGLVELPVPTPGGKQMMLCIRKKELAWWLVHDMDDKRCKPHIRGHLQEIKQAIIDAAERILFGDIEYVPESTRGIIAVSSRNEIVFACLDCGAKHRIVIVNGEPIVTLEREQ